MLEGRREHAACLYEDMIYVTGGMKPTKEVRRECEVFNPRTREWKTLKPMEYGRVRFGAGAVKGHLYACGGYDGKYNLKSVERLKLGDDGAEWQPVSDMNLKRNGHTIVAARGHLFAIGGYGGMGSNAPLDSVERCKCRCVCYSTSPWSQSHHIHRRPRQRYLGGDVAHAYPPTECKLNSSGQPDLCIRRA